MNPALTFNCTVMTALNQNGMTPVDPVDPAGACLDLLAGAGAAGSFPERRLKHIIYVECLYAVTELPYSTFLGLMLRTTVQKYAFKAPHGDEIRHNANKCAKQCEDYA